MRLVKYDENGYIHAAYLRDGDSDDAPERGVPICPPDLDLIDWKDTKRILYNELVSRGLFTWRDVQNSQSELEAVIRTVFRKKIISLYREKERAEQHIK